MRCLLVLVRCTRQHKIQRTQISQGGSENPYLLVLPKPLSPLAVSSDLPTPGEPTR